MTSTAQTESQPGGVHAVAVGEFGRAVAAELTTTLPDLVVTDAGATGYVPSAFWPTAGLRLLLSWREANRQEQALDAASFAWGTPWLPVVLAHPRLRVGPLVVPGRGACHGCFRARHRQHDRHEALGATLLEAYDDDPELGPAGFLPHHVTTAAALAEHVVHQVLEPDGAPAEEIGRVRHLHLLDGTFGSATVVGVHGCPRCRSGRPQRQTTWADLADEVPRLLASS